MSATSSRSASRVSASSARRSLRRGALLLRGNSSCPGLAHGCPVKFLWTRRMALILLCSKRLATFWDTEKDQAMLHQNSVFHGLLKHVPWHRFDRLVEDHGADARVRRLSTKSQLVALLYGQLSGAA